MKITVLAENNSRIDNYLLSEPALSLFIEHRSKKILFDTGYSSVFLQNATKLGINLENITDIILILKA
jgi:7,8-dihydropterin-6-yl-methyl-4-(beta-D-ribofuranosyl)aminobenzene 5'-phosphate synthase